MNHPNQYYEESVKYYQSKTVTATTITDTNNDSGSNLNTDVKMNDV